MSFSFESTKKSEIFLKYSPLLARLVRIVGRILPSDLMSRCAGPGRFFMLNFGQILCTPVHFSALILTVEKRLPGILQVTCQKVTFNSCHQTFPTSKAFPQPILTENHSIKPNFQVEDKIGQKRRKGQLISTGLLVSSFRPKYQQKILRVFALASKKRSNQKNKAFSYLEK